MTSLGPWFGSFSSAGGRLMAHSDLLLVDMAGPGVGLAQSSIYISTWTNQMPRD